MASDDEDSVAGTVPVPSAQSQIPNIPAASYGTGTLPTTNPPAPIRPLAPVVQPVTAQMAQPLAAAKDPLEAAIAALAAGNNEAAIDAATDGLASSPEQAAQLYRVLGTAHYRRGEFQAAQSALAQALSLDKADALAYFLMGSTLAKLGEHEAAAGHLAAAARLDARFAY